MESRFLPYPIKRVIEITVVAAAYYGAARLGLLLAFEKTNASPVWPPAGIALVAVLLWGYRVWPGIMIGAFLANVVVFLANHTAAPLTVAWVSLLIAAGNTLEALSGRFLLHRLVGSGTFFNRAQEVFKFGAVALLMCQVSAIIGPTVISLAGIASWSLYGMIWFTWWLGDTVGILVLTPWLLSWSRPMRTRWNARRYGEAVMLFVLLALAVWLAFGRWFHVKDVLYPLVFVTLPFLLWSAFRFGQREAANAVVIISGIAI